MQNTEPSGQPLTPSFERRSIPSPGLREAARQFAASLIGAVSELLKLIALECRVSAMAFSRMLAFSIVSGLLLATLWWLGLVITAFALRSFGLDWIVIAAMLVAVTVAGLTVTFVAMNRACRRIGLRGTLDVLRSE